VSLQIIFRVDASSIIGIGHARRCLTLARALAEYGSESLFVIRETDIEVEKVLMEYASTSIVLPKGTPISPEDYRTWLGADQRGDAEDFLAHVTTRHCDWVVVDHYGIDAVWHRHVRDSLSCKIAVIDDLANRSNFADLIVDQNFHANHFIKYCGTNLRNAPVLGGPSYALLDKAFADGPKWQPHDEVRSIGIFMGGADAGNATEQVLDMLRESSFSGKIEVVTGSGNPHLNKLRLRVAKEDNVDLSIDLQNLADFFAKHDLQIGAGGSATSERICAGAPTLALVCADNQRAILKDLAIAGYHWGAELNDRNAQLELMRIALGDSEVRYKMGLNCLDLVDGRGAGRVARALVTRLPVKIIVRKAQSSDAKMLHDWRNHPSIRSVSRNTGEISAEDHRRWFDESLITPGRELLIGELETGDAVGVVRFDERTRNEHEVSIYLDPRRLGQGLGPALLSASEVYLTKNRKSEIDIYAVTMSGNKTSEQLFIKAGYSRHPDCFRKKLNNNY
jgi:UDP-2,4-diacetamido-2,4,6-trideoxy-beta-L-altropyranose hydrolase